MILIDALVHSAGDAVSQLWKDEDGSGMYPPPSLHVSFFFFVVALVAHCGHLLYAVYRTPRALRLTVSEQCRHGLPALSQSPQQYFWGHFTGQLLHTNRSHSLHGESQKRPFQWTLNQTNECMAEGKNCKFWLEQGSAPITDQDYLLEWPHLCQIIQHFFW